MGGLPDFSGEETSRTTPQSSPSELSQRAEGDLSRVPSETSDLTSLSDPQDHPAVERKGAFHVFLLPSPPVPFIFLSPFPLPPRAPLTTLTSNPFLLRPLLTFPSPSSSLSHFSFPIVLASSRRHLTCSSSFSGRSRCSSPLALPAFLSQLPFTFLSPS